jgi:hypothetical protein
MKKKEESDKHVIKLVEKMLRQIIILSMICVMIFSNGCDYIRWGTGPSLSLPVIACNKTGGAVIIYQVYRWSRAPELHAQKINSDGNLQWGKYGTIISGRFPYIKSFKVLGDGFGGAFIGLCTYPVIRNQDSSSSSKMQRVTTVARVDNDGNIIWQKETSKFESISSMVGGGDRGIIIAGRDYQTSEFILQKVDSAGNFTWGADGVSLYPEDDSKRVIKLVSDGCGGAIALYTDAVTDSGLNESQQATPLYAQRIGHDGNHLWGQDGLLFHIIPEGQILSGYIDIVSDELGGAIVVWEQTNQGWDKLFYEIYVQRLDANGNILWQEDGSPLFKRWVAEVYYEKQRPKGHLPVNDPTVHLISDGSGGAIILWVMNWNFHAQKLSPSGEAMWPEQGVRVGRGSSSYVRLRYTAESDLSGGVIVTWWSLCHENEDLGACFRVQRISNDGTIMWPEGGVQVVTGAKRHINHAKIASDGVGGLIVTYGTGVDIYSIQRCYIQRIDTEGNRLWGEEAIQLR